MVTKEIPPRFGANGKQVCLQRMGDDRSRWEVTYLIKEIKAHDFNFLQEIERIYFFKHMKTYRGQVTLSIALPTDDRVKAFMDVDTVLRKQPVEGKLMLSDADYLILQDARICLLQLNLDAD